MGPNLPNDGEDVDVDRLLKTRDPAVKRKDKLTFDKWRMKELIIMSENSRTV